MPKSLGGKRKPLLSNKRSTLEVKTTEINCFFDFEILAVIGSKGGSGEFSQVVEIVEQEANCASLVISVNPDHKHEIYWKNNPQVTYMVADWQYDQGLNESLQAAKNIGATRLIMCIGVGSRAGLYDRVNRALGFCQEVFVTINTGCPMTMESVAFNRRLGIESCKNAEKLTWIDLCERNNWPSGRSLEL